MADGREFIVRVPDGGEGPLAGGHGVLRYLRKRTRSSLSDTNLKTANAMTVFTKGVNNAWAPAPYAATTVEQDVRYTDEVLGWVKQHDAVQPGCVYAVGMSHGGGFAQLLACQRPQEFAGVATVSAAYYDQVFSGCSRAPIARLDIHGTVDSVMYFLGGTRHGAHYRSDMDVAADIASRNRCAANPTKKTLGNVVMATWHGCAEPTVHYSVLGGHARVERRPA